MQDIRTVTLAAISFLVRSSTAMPLTIGNKIVTRIENETAVLLHVLDELPLRFVGIEPAVSHLRPPSLQ
jgi:hypothetical protein